MTVIDEKDAEASEAESVIVLHKFVSSRICFYYHFKMCIHTRIQINQIASHRLILPKPNSFLKKKIIMVLGCLKKSSSFAKDSCSPSLARV